MYWTAGGGGLLVVHDPEVARRVAKEIKILERQSLTDEGKNLLQQVVKAFLFHRPMYGILGIPIRSWAEKRAFLEPVLSRNQIQRPHAAVALRQALRFRERVARQRDNSLYLLSLLQGTEGVVLPWEWPGAAYNYHHFPVLMADGRERDAVSAAMLAQGVDTSLLYSDSIGHSRGLGYQGGCPVAESVAARLLTLPNYASLSRFSDAWSEQEHPGHWFKGPSPSVHVQMASPGYQLAFYIPQELHYCRLLESQ